MRKRRIYVLVPLLLIFMLIVQTAQAAGPRSYTSGPFLNFEGSTAHCSAYHAGHPTTDTISMTLTLYQNNEYVDSWSTSGNGYATLSGECPVEYGKTYRLELSVSINGVAQPTLSVTGTCRRT